MKKVKLIVLLIVASSFCYGQDPQFSQFFSSPLNINPALTARINSDWRFISNVKDQWIGPASPFITGTVSYDRKLFQNKIPNVDNSDDNVFGMGGMLMYDHAMSGIQKSTYGSLNLSYNVKFAEGLVGKHRLGLGFGATYGRRYVDFSRLYFQEQWIGYNGFNTNLPTGEAALSEMKPWFSASTGLVYSYYTEKSNFDLGAAVFHVNKPKQTFLEDPHQYLAMRKVIHANFETFIKENVVLNLNSIYQFQEEAKYYSFGGALGYFIGNDQTTLINFGAWYWSKHAVTPYIGLVKGDMQFGASYDFTMSKLRYADPRPKTFELSIILRGTKSPINVIPCPWK
jgi:type IX secretion system PorP/SprF family membrane protein